MARVEGVTPVTEAVARDLRHLLLAGELPAGAALTEAGVAERYEVARPTAKAAIERLVAERLLLRGPHLSASVPVLGTSDAFDIDRTRADVEGIALRRLAARREVPDDARRADAGIAALEVAPTLDLLDADLRFHAAMVTAAGSCRLSRLYLGLLTEARLCAAQLGARRALSPAQVHVEHGRLLALIVAGDGDEAVAALEDHLAVHAVTPLPRPAPLGQG